MAIPTPSLRTIIAYTLGVTTAMLGTRIIRHKTSTQRVKSLTNQRRSTTSPRPIT